MHPVHPMKRNRLWKHNLETPELSGAGGRHGHGRPDLREMPDLRKRRGGDRSRHTAPTSAGIKLEMDSRNAGGLPTSLEIGRGTTRA